MAQLNFDARTVPPAEPFEVIPEGWYNVVISESEMKQTSNQQGAMLALTMTILDGQYKGRKLFDRLNLQNQNAMAVEIAYKTLSAICHATGVIQCQDSAQLHNIPMQAKVKVRPAGPGADGKNYDAQNEVKGYKPVDKAGMAPSAPTPSQTSGWAPPPPAATTTTAPAWTPPSAPAPTAPPPQAAPQWTPPAQAPQAAPPQNQPPAWTPPAPQQPAPQAAPQWSPPPQNGNGVSAPTGAPAASSVPPWARPPQQ